LEEEMAMADQETYLCQVCGERKRKTDLVPVELIHVSIVDKIKQKHPAWSPGGYICQADLNRFMIDYVRDVVEKEKNEYASLKETEKPGGDEDDHLPKNDNLEYEEDLSFGEHLADRIAGFAGSWTFIAAFVGIISLWVGVNTFFLLSRPFDPYPYILLNLFLSMLASIQAPVIIMSQNRQEIRDRLHAERDYQVSIHSDSEIHLLHKKMDYLLTNQGQRLLEIQNIQVELMGQQTRKTP
jgi:uncharacterized membrane protein